MFFISELAPAQQVSSIGGPAVVLTKRLSQKLMENEFCNFIVNQGISLIGLNQFSHDSPGLGQNAYILTFPPSKA